MPVSAGIRDLCRAALARARRHPDVSHAEVRWQRDKSELLRVRDGAPDGIGEHGCAGFTGSAKRTG